MTIDVILETELPFSFDYEGVARQVAEEVLLEEGFSAAAEVSLTLTSEEEIASLNEQFRQIDAPTDVLSFPLLALTPGDYAAVEELSDAKNPENGNVMLGDIVLSVPRVVAQAEEYGHSQLREYAFLITHSMLHLLGYDHIDDAERGVMEQKQERILERVGIRRES